MGKVYAVKKGLVPGIYKTWEECKDNVVGFSGAIYKGFSSEQQAREFMGWNNQQKTQTPLSEPSGATTDVLAYVDGSYNVKTNKYAFGMVILVDGLTLKFADIGRDKDAVSMRNVAGEILAAEKAMLFTINNGFKSVKILYDYEGIEKWCTGEWQAKNEFTSQYREQYLKHLSKINISFEKVAAHTGDKYNEMADELAKSSIF